MRAAGGRTGGYGLPPWQRALVERVNRPLVRWMTTRFGRKSNSDILTCARWTDVVLAVAHRDHHIANKSDTRLAAFRQPCHMIHDRPEHQRRRWRMLFRRMAMGDLFGNPFLLRTELYARCVNARRHSLVGMKL